MGLAGFISKIVQSITRTTFKFNKTLDDLISKFKDSCPSTQELKGLIIQKNQINGALQQIQGKIATLNTVADTSEVVVKGVKAGVTIIKLLPIPTSVPPGIGIPVSIINMFSDALDTLGTLIDKEESSLEAIPEALELISKDVGEVISKLNEFDVVLNDCLEKDPDITQDILDTIDATTGNFMGVLTNEELGEILSNPPGLLYGDYYLRLNFINTDGFSFNKKQITAQNKESVPPPGDYYLPGASIEILYGDESFSSSDLVLVNEMKWHIDIKDLYFPPPPPAEDPLKTYSRIPLTTILTALFGADDKQANELYEIAWDLSKEKGWWYWKYDDIVEDAFNNGKTVLEQSVAFIGERWERGEIVLDRDIEITFLGDINDEDEKNTLISQIKSEAYNIRHKANEIGGNYNWSDRTWELQTNFTTAEDTRIHPYSLRLAQTADYSTNNVAIVDAVMREEVKKRRRRWQSTYEAVKYIKEQNIINHGATGLTPAAIVFDDPLEGYFDNNGVGYDNISNPSFFPYGKDKTEHDHVLNLVNLLYQQKINTLDGRYHSFWKRFTFYHLLYDTGGAGLIWYDKYAPKLAEDPIWFGDNDPNNHIDYPATDPDYFYFPKDYITYDIPTPDTYYDPV